MEIKNEIKGKDEKKQFVQRSLADIQRAKLEKLMKNPDKPVVIPEKDKKESKEYVPPSFIRNVMGSSAGAGSGEFHVYRHLRRKEYARQKHMKLLSEKEILDMEFEEKLEENKRKAEDRTNKKREKRLKKKLKQKSKGKKPKLDQDDKRSSDDESENSYKSDDEAKNSDFETKIDHTEDTSSSQIDMPEKETDGQAQESNETNLNSAENKNT